MLTKIGIFNSSKHAKAIITLDKSSIQLVGENQIGKTALIDTLNFLYIIKKQNMSFDNGKYHYSQTLNHLFPSEKHSFVIFETFKKSHSYFCILVKRKFDDVEYYRINLPLDEIPIFKSNNQIRDFAELEEYFLSLGSGIYLPLDKVKLFQLVYSYDQTKNAVVWINHKVNRIGQSLENSFTEVYRYLINSKLISADTLQESLIIADNKNVTLNVFSDNSKKENISKLKEIQADIDNLSEIKQPLESFKDIVAQYAVKSESVGKQYYIFIEYTNSQSIALQNLIDNSIVFIENLRNLIENKENGLEIRKDKLYKEIWTCEHDIKQKNAEIEESHKILREIQRINVFNLSTVELINVLNDKKAQEEENANNINYLLQRAKKSNHTAQYVKNEIENWTRKKKSIENQLQNRENLLIYNITPDTEKQQLLNALLSEDLLNLPKEKIKKTITHFTENLQIFDGEILIDDIAVKPLKTVEELYRELDSAKTMLKEYEEELKAISDLKKLENDLSSIKTKIRGFENDILKVSSKESTELKVNSLSSEISLLSKQLIEENAQLESIIKEIKDKRESIKKCENEINNYKKNQSDIERYYEDLSSANVFPVECEILPITDLETFVKNLKKEIKALYELKINKNNKFNELKIKLNRIYASEKEFIESVSNEIDTLYEKEKLKEDLLESISNQIIQPVQDYLNAYTRFKRDFINSFNRSISKYKISKISELRIEVFDNKTFIEELQCIAKVKKLDIGGKSLFDKEDSEQQRGLEKLDEYLKKSRDYDFSELFEIKIKVVYQDGTSKTIDLKKQDESTGTIRMINLVVFLLVIKYFKVDAEDNKIVFFVDELSIDQKNISELIEFCKDNGFIAIFAANQQGMGIEKYYLMKPSSENGNRVVLDEMHTGKIRKRNE